MINLSQKIAPHFYPVHRAIRDETHDEFWLKGGRGSTKSSFAAIEIVLGIMGDSNANAIVFRKVSATLRDSVQASFLWAIDELDESENFDSISSPPEITYRPTGQKIILKGLDDSRKLKSIKVRHGYFKYLWFEEADEFSGESELRSVQQSILRGGEKFVEFFTYNPPKDPRHWINKLAKEDSSKQFHHHSTYLDVPEDWLGAKFLQKANRLKKNNFEAYLHEYLGKCVGNPKEKVFSGKYEVRDFETPELSEVLQNRFFFGADWGFSQDPTVLIRMFIKDDCLYIDYECYKIGVEIDHIGKVIFDKIPESRKWRIESDGSRPETISNLRRQKDEYGKSFDVVAAKKWKGCVEDGIEYLKSFERIIIHSRCPIVAAEFDALAYKVDKETSDVLPIIDDKKTRQKVDGLEMTIKDDGLDCVRYGIGKYIRPPQEVKFIDF